MVCKYFKRLRRKKPMVVIEVPTFDRLAQYPKYVYRRHGTLTPTARIAIHTLAAKRIKASEDISQRLPLGAAGTRKLLAEERREADRVLWRRFLGLDEENNRQIYSLTHTIYWGYLIRSHNLPKELLSASLNFSVSGHDADWVCRQCLDFVADHALRQRSHLAGDGSLLLPPLLIQTTVTTRIVWLSLLYMRWRWLAIGQ